MVWISQNQVQCENAGCATFVLILCQILRCSVRFITVLCKEMMSESPRRWSGPDGLNHVMFLGSCFMQLYMCIADEPYICRVARYREFESIVRPDEHRNIIYCLMSLETRSFYVGRTNNMIRRYREHLTCAVKSGDEHQKLYHFMDLVGRHNFILVQIRQEFVNIGLEEVFLIKRLSPRLNTAHAKRRKRRRHRPVLHMRKKLRGDPGYARKFSPRRLKTTMFSYEISGEYSRVLQCCSLSDMFAGQKSHFQITIWWEREERCDSLELTSWRDLVVNYRMSSVLHPSPIRDFDSLIHHIRVTQRGYVVVDVVSGGKRVSHASVLQKIVKAPRLAYLKLYRMNLSEVLTVYNIATYYPGSTSLKDNALCHIQNVMVKRYGIRSIPTLVMKIPFTPGVKVCHIRQAVRRVLDLAVTLPVEIKSSIIRKFRIVNTRRKRICDILHNARGVAKSFDINSVPECVCMGDEVGGHKLLLPEDLLDWSDVLCQNNRNIPVPTKIDLLHEIELSFSNVLVSVEKLMCQREENVRDFSNSGCYDSRSCSLSEMFREKNSNFDEVRELLAMSAVSSLNLMSGEFSHAVSETRVCEVRRYFSGFVMLPLDKNAGKTAIVCCKKYCNDLKTLFPDDLEHYDNVTARMSEQEILDKMLATFIQERWERLARYNKNGKLPYAYAVYKNKDVSRLRTIVSFYQHPLKFVYRVVQRALLFALKSINLDQFTLHTTEEYVLRIRQLADSLKNVFGSHTEFLPFSYDIKECFTALRPAYVVEGIEFVLETYFSTSRSKFIKIPHDRSLKPSSGKSCNHHLYACLSSEIILSIVRFDLENAYFSVGSQCILRQKMSAPIGGVLSSIYAIIVCAYSEHRWLSSLGVDRRLICGVRYVDDLTGFTVCSSKVQPSRYRAVSLQKSLQKVCYPIELLLKPEIIENGSYSFLETITTVKGTHVGVCHNLKNWVSIRDHGCQEIFSLKSALSFEKGCQKRGALFSRLLVAEQNTPDCTEHIQVIKSFFCELRFLGFSKRVMKSLIFKMRRRSSRAVWELSPSVLIPQ